MDWDSYLLAEQAHTDALGRACAQAFVEAPRVPEALVIYLRGELGAGKSTFARAMLRALGVQGRIKSPTYALIEPYEVKLGLLLHLDLYRLSDPRELDYLGIEQLLDQAVLCLIEWPERAQGYLLPCDLEILLEHSENGRIAELRAKSERGKLIKGQIEAILLAQSIVKSVA